MAGRQSKGAQPLCVVPKCFAPVHPGPPIVSAFDLLPIRAI